MEYREVIEARRPSWRMWWWMGATGVSAVLLIAAVGIKGAGLYITGSRGGDIALLLAAAAGCVATFVLTAAERRSIDPDEKFILREWLVREVWPAAFILLPSYALIPIAVGLVGVSLVDGLDLYNDSTFEARATIDDGAATVSTWRVSRDGSQLDGPLVPASPGSLDVAPLGKTVVLEGSWSGGTAITITSVRDWEFTEETVLGWGGPTTTTCVVVSGRANGREDAMPDLGVFLTSTLGTAPVRPVEESEHSGPYTPGGACQTGGVPQRGLSSIAARGGPDGQFSLVFEVDAVGSPEPPYVGIMSAQGAVLYVSTSRD